MEIIGISPMYRQHPHEGQHMHHHHHHQPQQHPNSYQQYQNISAMNGRRSMSTHFDTTYPPVYQTNHVGYNLQYQSGYDYVQQQPQTMIPSYHPSPPQHHNMQPAQQNMFPPPPLPPPINPNIHGMRDNLTPQQSPTVKRELVNSTHPQAIATGSALGMEQIGEENGAKTDVDTLMRAIQSKTTEADLASPMQPNGSMHLQSGQVGSQDRDAAGKPKKKYQCTFPSCGKFFYQKTHLEIHMRAHTGHKPFLCREPSCGQRFSQLGNLKTHERRHTGERPYSCDACGKRFAQRGNVRAHRVVHEQVKPFTCKLDSCGKNFTQLGNLKSHQNKFHSRTIQDLTAKFASSLSIQSVTPAERELWEYFSNLYKNSNRGIKGRGKDRRIATASSPATSTRSDSDRASTRSRKRKPDELPQLVHHHGLPPMRSYSSGERSSGSSEHE